MSTKTATKEIAKIQKGTIQKELTLLISSIRDYKVERKANWKSFKNKTNHEIDAINKSIIKLSISK